MEGEQNPEQGPSDTKKSKVNPGDIDEWLQDVVCVGESVKPVKDVIEQAVGK
jgi:hypothetical protein